MLLLWKLVHTFRVLEIGGKKSRPWTPALFYFLVRFRCRAKGVHCENSRLPLAAGKQKSRIPPEKPDSFYNSCVILHGFFMNSTAICCSDKNKTGEKIQNKLLTLFLIWFFFKLFQSEFSSSRILQEFQSEFRSECYSHKAESKIHIRVLSKNIYVLSTFLFLFFFFKCKFNLICEFFQI